jgi:hypothetical protein
VKGYEDAPSTKENTSKEKGGDVYLTSSSTHADHKAWLVDSVASFHMTPTGSGSVNMKGMMEVMFS